MGADPALVGNVLQQAAQLFPWPFVAATAAVRSNLTLAGRIEALERELVQRQDVVNRALQAHNDMRQRQAELLKDFDVSFGKNACVVDLECPSSRDLIEMSTRGV